MIKKRGKMGFNPDNPNKLDKNINQLGYELSAQELDQYKRLRQRALAKGRRLKAKKGVGYYALGGAEYDRKLEGKEYFENAVSKYLDAKRFTTKPQFKNKEEFDKYVKDTSEFLERGGELKQINKGKKALKTTLLKVDYGGSSNIDDLFDYIDRMDEEEFAKMMSMPELYDTIKELYMNDELDNYDFLESFKSFSGYNVQTGQETEKQWKKAYKRRYGRDVRE